MASYSLVCCLYPLCHSSVSTAEWSLVPGRWFVWHLGSMGFPRGEVRNAIHMSKFGAATSISCISHINTYHPCCTEVMNCQQPKDSSKLARTSHRRRILQANKPWHGPPTVTSNGVPGIERILGAGGTTWWTLKSETLGLGTGPTLKELSESCVIVVVG